MDERPVSRAPGDSEVGAFSAEEPWTVEPDKLVWKQGLDALRKATHAEVPGMAHPTADPARRPGSQLSERSSARRSVLWWITDRRKGPARIARRAVEKAARRVRGARTDIHQSSGRSSRPARACFLPSSCPSSCSAGTRCLPSRSRRSAASSKKTSEDRSPSSSALSTRYRSRPPRSPRCMRPRCAQVSRWW